MKFSENDLKHAAKAVDQAMLDNLPPPETPSPQLLEKLDNLTAKPARKPKWKTVLSRVAACIMAFVVVGGFWLATDVDARAAILQWMRDFTQEHYGYYFKEMEDRSELPEYDFGWMPSGWEKSPFGDTESTHHRFGYHNFAEGNSINLLYFYPKSNSSYMIRPYQGLTIEHSVLIIRNSQADLYRMSGAKNTNLLIWIDPDSGLLFQVSGDLPEEEDLIRMMESLCPAETQQE